MWSSFKPPLQHFRLRLGLWSDHCKMFIIYFPFCSRFAALLGGHCPVARPSFKKALVVGLTFNFWVHYPDCLVPRSDWCKTIPNHHPSTTVRHSWCLCLHVFNFHQTWKTAFWTYTSTLVSSSFIFPKLLTCSDMLTEHRVYLGSKPKNLAQSPFFISLIALSL